MSDLSGVKADVVAMGVSILAKRVERLKNRKLVIFPWLRVALLLRKIEKLSKV